MRILGIAVLIATSCGPSTPDETSGLTSIEIVPADASTAWDDGVTTPIEYAVIGHYEDGHTAPLVDAELGLDLRADQLGSLAGAEFTATGDAAGIGMVLASAGDFTATTSVTVSVRRVHIDPSAPDHSDANFPDVAPPGALAPTIVYPLAGAVMPAAVKPADVQWEGPAVAGDLFRVRITGGLATVDTVVGFVPGFAFDARLSADDWNLIKTSAAGGPIRIAVDHWDAVNGAHGAPPVDVRTIGSDVGGVVYYWDLDRGQIWQIDALGRTAAIANPPAQPTDPTNRCIACHTVSRDGRYLAGALWQGGDKGAVFDMSDPIVRTADPAPTRGPLNPGTYNTLFSTFNPDATRMIANNGTAFSLVDPLTAVSVPQAGVPLPSAGAAHPAWSPDGASIAFVNNIAGGPGWAVDYSYGDLQVIPVTGPDTFGAPVPLVDGAADPDFAAPSWPSFSPDSRWIAYAAGTYSRGRLNGVTYPGALFLIDRAGGPATELATACAAARDCYLPNFSPYDAGGYFWLVFYSFRDYGNAQAGTKGTARRQMWVTAIDKSLLGTGTDPSSVPYWLPDQDTQSDNMSAFWAIEPPIQ